jgi:hypothetical protein
VDRSRRRSEPSGRIGTSYQKQSMSQASVHLDVRDEKFDRLRRECVVIWI